ncbi:thiaminase II [Pediococcus stilesii]|uniref:Aminopyrimidine aminohydrolase n=1 Tax=Pediococcus stilesii TaxID=331679 RepID=A0A0R2L4L4_9LACO|nr:thiaminase II [Pediococcus stilesii]KRN94742.1 transcription activator [Pediococcus stilesii]
MFSEQLKRDAAPILTDIENHPFVEGIRDGAVSRDALMVYVEQDTRFLEAFVKVYAGALEKSKTKKQMQFFDEQIRYTLNDEAGAHKILCGIADEALEEHQNAEIRPATYLYNEHLFNALRTGQLIDIAAAMLPCPWTYNEISKKIISDSDPTNPFLPWIEFYQPEEGKVDDSMVNTLFSMIDELAEEASAAHLKRVEERFLRSCEFEYDFWDQAYYQQDWKYHLQA